MRSFRKTTRHWKLGTLSMVAAALLATTACESGDDTAGDAASPKPTASSPASAQPGGSGNTGGTGGEAGTTGGDSGGTGGETDGTSGGGDTDGSATGGGEDAAEGDACTDANTDVTAEFALPAHKDDSKLLLTVTNTGDKACRLFGHPAVKFGEAQSVPPAFEDSKPQSVVVLDPGGEGYAGVLANRSKPDATTETTLTVAFQGENIGDDTGEATAVELPSAEGVVVDDSIRVTYWQSDSESAVSPLFSG
ncbi:DUF4232 domain-containing protein [Streptomyces capparidis]